MSPLPDYQNILDQFNAWLAHYPFSPLQTAGLGVGVLTAYGLYAAFKKLVVDPYYSPFKALPGPKGYDSILWGHMRRIFESPPAVAHEEWMRSFGPTFRFRGLFLAYRFYTADPRAVAHILNHSENYPKPTHLRGDIIQIFGKGLLFAEGADHRRQRRIMNPCFGIAQIRDLLPVFYDKAYHLRDILLTESTKVSPDGEGVVDVFFWLTRATLDIIGSAGFDYEFNSLVEGDTNELARAFNTIFSNKVGFSAFAFFRERIAPLRLIPNKRSREVAQSIAVMERIGSGILQEKKQAILNQGKLEKKDIEGHDLLSMMIKANMAVDTAESQRLTDQEVLGQISTFLIAGHETTSASVTWLLYTLAADCPDAQVKLREELLSVKSDHPSMEEINALPYFDAVIRENLRLNAVVPATLRIAGKDDVIPLGQSFVDANGVERTEVKVSKGDPIFISMQAMNRDKTIWGEDAFEFKPERWLSGDTPSDLPGVHAGLMTFIGGPRACIGYRFALLEMKVLAFALIRSFAFEFPDPAIKVERKANLVTRPLVTKASGEVKTEMPLRLRALASM